MEPERKSESLCRDTTRFVGGMGECLECGAAQGETCRRETWLICGGRDFTDADGFGNAMGSLVHAFGMPSRVVHGDCPTGADSLADAWARFNAIDVRGVRADWKKHRKAAGPIRNQEMLDHYHINRVVAFPGGRGTADMTSRARKAGIPVIEIRSKP